MQSSPAPWFGPSGTAYSSPTGTANVVPFQGDFDGDGVTDLAYYNLSTATWTIAESSNFAAQGALTFTMGTPNLSIPVVGYFSPNGGQLTQTPKVGQTAEPAVMTYSNGQDVWTIASSNQGNYTVTFPMPGQPGDIPVPGDYDGVGYDELAIYRPSTAQFFVQQLNGTVTPGTKSFDLTSALAQFGLSGDLNSLVPVPAQYDNVAIYKALASPPKNTNVPIFGHTEAAIYDPVQGVFLILGPNGAYTVSGFQPGDIPAPADYLGAGQDQVVAYRPSNGQFIQETPGVSGQAIGQSTITTFQPGGIPVMAPLSYRLPSTITAVTGPGGGTTTGSGGGTTTTGSGGGTTTTGSGGGTTTGSTTTTGIQLFDHDNVNLVVLQLGSTRAVREPSRYGTRLEAPLEEGGDEEGPSHEEAGQAEEGGDAPHRQEGGDAPHRQEGACRSRRYAPRRDGRQDGGRGRRPRPSGRSRPGECPGESAVIESEAPRCVSREPKPGRPAGTRTEIPRARLPRRDGAGGGKPGLLERSHDIVIGSNPAVSRSAWE